MADTKTMIDRLQAPWHWKGALGGIQTRDGARIEVVLSYDSSAALVDAVNAATGDERGETPFVIWLTKQGGWMDRLGMVHDLEQAACYSRDRAMEICYAGSEVAGALPPPMLMMRLDDARRATIWFRNNAKVQS